MRPHARRAVSIRDRLSLELDRSPALQRGEIHLHSETTPGFFSVVEPSLVKGGTVIPLYYDGNFDGDWFSVPKVMENYPLPQFQDFYRSLKGGLPTGRLWDAYRTNLAVDSAMLRTVVMPPGVPAAAVDALRTALARLNNDKDYAEEAMKAMQFVPHYETGADINTRVAGSPCRLNQELRAK